MKYIFLILSLFAFPAFAAQLDYQKISSKKLTTLCNIDRKPKDVNACYELAKRYEQGKGIQRNLMNAKAAYGFACEHLEQKEHRIQACFMLAGLSQSTTHPLFGIYDKLCFQENHIPSCHAAADMSERGWSCKEDYGDEFCRQSQPSSKKAAIYRNKAIELEKMY